MSSWINKNIIRKTRVTTNVESTNNNTLNNYENNNCIKYISGGLLGDFIFQLSIICEMYHKTNRKGILYITNSVGDKFRFGLEDSYLKTKKLVESQEYIKEYHIYNNESYDINLSKWRDSPLLWNTNWINLFSFEYNINWGNNIWLTLPKNTLFENKIVITHSINNYNSIDKYINFFKDIDTSKLVFVYLRDEDLLKFLHFTGLKCESYKCSDFYDLAIIINSSLFHISNCSSPLSISMAIKKKCNIFLTPTEYEQILFKDIESTFNCQYI
jgi:hypothetical protein